MFKSGVFRNDDKNFLYVSLAFAAALCVWPFLVYVHRHPWPSFYSEWLAFALGLAALLPLLRLSLWQQGLPAIALFPLALIVWLFVQTACGHGGPYGALPATIYLLWFAALIVLSAALRRVFGLSLAVEVFAWALFVGAAMNTFAGLSQHYDWQTPLRYLIDTQMATAVYGNLAQPNHYADYLAMGLVSLVYLYARGRVHAGIAVVAAAPMVFAMGLSGSRSAWVFVIALPLLALLLLRRGATNRRWLWATVVVLVGFALAQWLMTTSFFASALDANTKQVITSTERVLGAGADSTTARMYLWRESWHLFLQQPLFGVGMGGLAWPFYQFQASSTDAALHNLPYNNTHNLFLQWLVEAGIVGGGLVIAACVFWLRGLWRAAASLEEGWIFGIVAVLGIHSMVEYPLWYSYFLGILGLVVGLGAPRFVKTNVYAWLPRAYRIVATVVLCLGTFYLVAIWVNYRAFEGWRYPPEDADAAYKAMAQQQMPAWSLRTLAAIDRDPLLTPYIEVSLVSNIGVSMDHIERNIVLNTQAMYFKPTPDIVYRQAMLLAERDAPGDADAARTQFEGALRVYPNVLPKMMESLLKLTQTEPKKFKPLLELATSQLAKAAQAGIGTSNSSSVLAAPQQKSGKE